MTYGCAMLKSHEDRTRPHRDQEPAITRQSATNPAPIDANEPWMRELHADTGYLLYRLGLRSGQLFNACLQESGLRLRHYAVLRLLATSEGALQRELSVRLGYDPSAIVGLVDDLEKQGFAERRPSPTTAAAGSSY